jgi:multidrug efflux pump subunit AcrB
VEVYGGRKRSIEVLLDEDAMRAYGLTAGQVSSKISEQSGKRLYLGQAQDARKEYFVNLISEYTELPSIGDLVVKDKGPVVLRQIAKITEGGADEQTISRFNGQEAVTLSLQRSWEANLISLARRTRQAVAALNAKVKPDGISLVVAADEAKTIEDNIQSIVWLIAVGGLLAIAVLWLFLRNAALVLTVSASIPISILISMNIFYALHITINTLTMVGLAIAIGMLVDCSVVVLENIVRHASRTQDVRQAIVRGTTEVARAVFASTLTTIAVFLPFLFSTNTEIRTLGAQAGAAIITTLLVSLAVAFFLIPVLADRFFSRREKSYAGRPPSVRPMSRMRQIYTVLLKTCLRYPARTLAATVGLFFLSLGLCLTLSVNVPREVQLLTFNVYAMMSSGTTLEATDEQVKAMDALLTNIPEVSDRLATIEEGSATFAFKLVDDFSRTSTRTVTEIKDDIVNRLSRAYPRVEFSTTEPTQNSRYMGGSGGGSGGGIGGGSGRQSGVSLTRLLGIGTAQEKVLVHGQDLGLLRSVAEDVQYNISNLDTVQTVRISVSNQSPSIDLLLDQASMSHFNVSLQAVRNELSGFQRETTSDIKFKAGNEEIDIILKSASEKEKKTEDLRRLQFPSTAGGLVPLQQLSRLVYSTGYSNINRVNQEKQVQVTYRFNSDIEQSKSLLEAARASVEDLVSSITPPPGVMIEVVRDESDMSEFYFLIVLGVLLIYMILASTFEGFRAPLVMMFTLPLAGIGAFSGLILTSNSLYNANVLVGFLILFGVVVNNGVLLIDYSRRLERRKQRRERALMTAGLIRVRPILITAITTILGMLPVAMGKQEYISLIGAPFAITVIGGLGVATLFTLVLIPTFSYGLENALQWWRGLNWKLKAVQALVFAGGEWFLIANIESFL